MRTVGTATESEDGFARIRPHEASREPSPLDPPTRGLAARDRDALERLLPMVYSELRRIAARQLKNERPGHTLQPTALVHEAYLTLADQRQVDWQNQAHFFGVAARVMRRVLVNYSRRRMAVKRFEGAELVSIEQASDVASSERPVLVLNAALDQLEKIDPELGKTGGASRVWWRQQRRRPSTRNLEVDRQARVADG